MACLKRARESSMDKDRVMPKHQYVPDPRLQDWMNRILAHPFENSIAFISIAFGAALIVAAVYPEFTPSKSMDNIEPVSAVVMAIINVLGGEVDRSGRRVAGTGLGVYGMTVAYSFPQSWFSWGQPFVLALACAVRVVALTITKRWTRLSREALRNE